MDVVTFGETMILLTPDSRIRYANSFTKKIGGAESNVAIGLARLNHKVGWFSRLGDEELGKSIISFIRGEGVDVSRVTFDNNAQTAIYFKELRGPSHVRVQYYRQGSAASMMTKEDLDESYISKAKYLHLTGITPALSDDCYKMTLEAISIARKHGLKIVFDPNIRKQLWSKEKAKEILLEIALQADYFLPGISEGEFLTGESDPTKIYDFFNSKGVENVIIKAGAKGAYYGTNSIFEHVEGFYVEHVVDPVGAGDGFAAGFISGLIESLPLNEAVRRGNAVGALVTMVNGDVEGLPEREELDTFMANLTEDVIR